MNENKTSTHQEQEQFKLRLQELEEILKNYSLTQDDEDGLSEEEYEDLLYEYETLSQQLYAPEKAKSKWDEINMLIPIYGIIQLVLCLPWMMYDIIGPYFLGVFARAFPGTIYSSKFLRYLSFYFIPIILLLISFMIYVNIKKKVNKIAFIIVWVIQAVLLIIGGVIIYITYLKDMILL